jgi:hypothetical protein
MRSLRENSPRAYQRGELFVELLKLPIIWQLQPELNGGLCFSAPAQAESLSAFRIINGPSAP